MAVSNLPIRFTDEKYLTKVEVIKELQLSLIDDIWKDILNYRNAYKTQLTIKTIPQIPFGVTLTDVISAKVEAFGSLLTRFNEAFNKLPKGSKEREAFDVYAKTRLLRDVGFLEKASLPEANLKAVIAGIEPVDLPSRKLSSYCQALSYLQQAAGQPLGEDLVGAYYQRLLGDEEMTVFYRISDPVTANMYRTMHFSKEHEFAPYGMIPDCMEELSSFATNVSYNPIIKAFGALYYIDYVRPFECHSETVAALFAKNILANSYYYDCIAYVPFESVLVKNDRYKEYSKHCQREADLTYIILYGLDILTKRVEDLIYYAGTSYRDLLHNEVYQAPEQKVAETKKDPVQIDIFEASKEPKEEPKPVPTPAKEPEPVLEEKKEEPEEEELETIQEPIVNNTYTYVSSWNTSYVYYEPERPKPAPEKKPEPVVQEEPTLEPAVEPEPFVEPAPEPIEEKFEPAPEPEPTPEPIEEKAVEPEIEPKAEEPHVETSQEKMARLLAECWPTQNAPKKEEETEEEKQMSLLDDFYQEEPISEEAIQQEDSQNASFEIAEETSEEVDEPSYEPEAPYAEESSEQAEPAPQYQAEPTYVPEPEPVEEAVEPAPAENKVEPEPYVAPAKEEQAVSIIDKIPEAPLGANQTYAPKAPSISDKEVKAYAKYLMEINPSLRKAQALFYASHNQVGRYYTIQDYKKTMKVVYETARTSMDHLAEEGFYKKLQIKNKFVYTPTQQGETK